MIMYRKCLVYLTGWSVIRPKQFYSAHTSHASSIASALQPYTFMAPHLTSRQSSAKGFSFSLSWERVLLEYCCKPQPSILHTVFTVTWVSIFKSSISVVSSDPVTGTSNNRKCVHACVPTPPSCVEAFSSK